MSVSLLRQSQLLSVLDSSNWVTLPTFIRGKIQEKRIDKNPREYQLCVKHNFYTQVQCSPTFKISASDPVLFFKTIFSPYHLKWDCSFESSLLTLCVLKFILMVHIPLILWCECAIRDSNHCPLGPKASVLIIELRISPQPFRVRKRLNIWKKAMQLLTF